MQMLNTAALCWRVKLRNAICLAFALALTGCSASKPAGVLRLPGAGGGSDGAGADWIGGFAACYAAYGDLAADAARWADQVNGLQGFIRGVRP